MSLWRNGLPEVKGRKDNKRIDMKKAENGD